MHTNFPILKTERLLLRQFVASDIENVFKGLSHPEVIKYYGISFQTIEETNEQMVFFASLEKEKTGIWWAICSADNQTFFGGGGFHNLCNENHKAEIGFWLLPEFWRKGIMKEAMPLLCNFGFENLNLHRIEGFVESENENCKKAMEKLDFHNEGTMKECEIKNGKYISLEIFAKINAKKKDTKTITL